MKNKIVYIAPHLSTGGMPQYLYKEIEVLQNDFDIYCIEWGDVTGGVLVVQRNKIKTLLGNRLLTLGENKWELLDMIKRIQPDVIHLQEIPELFIPHDIAKELYDKNRTYTIIETSHDSSTDPNTKRHFPDKFLFVSQYQLDLYKELGIPSDVVEYPIEFFQRTKTKEEAQRFLGLDPNLKHVINVGLFTPRKNQAEIVEYAKALKDYPIQFHFIGNHADNFRYYWEPIMKEFPSNCKWWNERTDVENFYQAADLFLFTSRGNNNDKETMPLVVREAISWQVPSLIYNLSVYLNYFDKYSTIQYLNTTSNKKNHSLILESLGINSSSKFFTMNGEEDLSSLTYPNSTWDTLQQYGDAAAQYFATYLLKELEPSGFTIDSNSVFVDLGANIGMSSRYAKEHGAKEVWCFEPDPNLIKIIQKNVPTAKIHRYAVGKSVSNLELYHWPFNPVNQGPKYSVDSIDLKQVLKIVNKSIDYLKIDIEGYEEGIFDNLTNEECSTIKKMFLEHHNPNTTSALISTLQTKGFKTFVQYGMGQNYIYATYDTTMKKEENDYGFNSNWELSEQKMWYSVTKDVNFPVILSIKDYQSDSVIWAIDSENIPAGMNFWIIPVSKHVKNFEEDPSYSGVKFCVYVKETNEQIYEKPYFYKFINIPTVKLSNFVPYQVNYEEFFVNKKYDRWLNREFKFVVDAGANVGVFSEYMIRNRFAENILAIECDSIALKDLVRNFELSDRVSVSAKALHENKTPIKFYQSKINPVISSTLSPNEIENHMAGIKGDTEYTVDTITLEEIIEKYGTIDLLKIDIEGAEYNLLDNTPASIFENVNNLFIECHFFEKNSSERYLKILDKLKSLGYLVEEYIENQSQAHIGRSECIFAKKQQKTILIIDSYADTDKKLSILKECIRSLKPLGIDILITTHKQIPTSIAELVDYVIFDKDNRFNQINFYTGYSQTFADFDLEVWTTPDMNIKSHEFPIIKAIRNGLSFAQTTGYTNFIFTEFDNIYTENDLDKIRNELSRLLTRQKKFLFHKNDSTYETIFFMGDCRYMKSAIDEYFPKTLEEYDKTFSYKYPYKLELFFYDMLQAKLSDGIILDTTFGQYFDSSNKNYSRVSALNMYIIPDQHKNYHVCIQVLDNLLYEVDITLNDKVVCSCGVQNYIKPAYQLESEYGKVKGLFKQDGEVIKEFIIEYYPSNFENFDKRGKLNTRW